MNEAVKAPSLGDVVSAAAFLVGLAAAWLYAAGWSYVYEYFDVFRIPMLLADVPREHLFVYGALTIWKNPVAAIVIALLLMLTTIVCIRYRAALGRSILVAIVVTTVLTLFVVARLGGVRTAAEDAAFQQKNDYSAYPRVVIELKGGAEEGTTANSPPDGCGRLVLATSEWIFLIAPRRDAPALALHTVVLPWEKVSAVLISGTYTSCP